MRRMMESDAVLYVISIPNLSRRRLEQLQRQTALATPLPSLLIRLEGSGTSLPEALDTLHDAAHQRVLVQPLGMPFSESLLAWLPGAIAHWQADRGAETMEIAIGRDAGTSPELLETAVAWALDHAAEAVPVTGAKPSLGKRGWQNPPDFHHHLLVCTGPRCQYRDAASLVVALKEETSRQGIADQCLTTRTGCLFPCNQGPLVALYPKGEWYRLPDAESVRRFVSGVLINGDPLPEFLIHTARQARAQQ
jgi:(2Fe-2S) ferredoxin